MKSRPHPAARSPQSTGCDRGTPHCSCQRQDLKPLQKLKQTAHKTHRRKRRRMKKKKPNTSARGGSPGMGTSQSITVQSMEARPMAPWRSRREKSWMEPCYLADTPCAPTGLSTGGYIPEMEWLKIMGATLCVGCQTVSAGGDSGCTLSAKHGCIGPLRLRSRHTMPSTEGSWTTVCWKSIFVMIVMTGLTVQALTQIF